MIRIRIPAAAFVLSSLLWNVPQASAQPPGTPRPPSALSLPTLSVAPVEVHAVVPCETCATPKKICVSEPKKNTKVVYNSKCQEYCLPSCGSLFDRLCGGGSCEPCKSGECGPVRTRNVLVKKKVPDCDTMTCVLKDAPACETTISMPSPPVVVPMPLQPAPKSHK